MKALLFPGQGSQIVGMGSEFYNNFDEAKNIFLEADETLKFKISKIILEGPENELKLTQNTQPAILLTSYTIFTILKKKFNFDLNQINFFAGHSLGEYSALVCANSLKFKDALYLLNERGKAMQEAVPVGEGAMLAVLGCEIEEIEKYIKLITAGGVCEIANDNANGQTIVSGNSSTINNLKDILKKNNKKSILLPVSAPFHCSLMISAAEKMKSKIEKTNFNKPQFQIVNNVQASVENESNTFKKLLVEQIYSRVRWRESIIYMAKNGVDHFIEIGPGKVLSGLIKRIIQDVDCSNINSIVDMQQLTK
ncbi:MAG: ACP S-malonyltransferase [Pelagibacteraceae bacterium]